MVLPGGDEGAGSAALSCEAERGPVAELREAASLVAHHAGSSGFALAAPEASRFLLGP